MQMGSNSFYKPSVDFYGPLNKNIAYRFVGTYQNAESFRDFVKSERYYINPSFLFKLSDKTEILLQGDYLNDDWTPDFGTGAIGKEIADIPRNKYLGATWSNGHTEQTSVSILLNHKLNHNWNLNFNTAFQNFSRTSKGTERIQPKENPYGDWDRPLGQNKALEQIAGDQISLQGNFATGKIKHQLFTGIDFDNTFAEAYTYAFLEKGTDGKDLYPKGIYDQINIFDYTYDQQNNIIPVGTNTKIVKTETNRFGIYFQDLISITEKFKVLAGLRWSWQEADANTTQLNLDTNQWEPLPPTKPAIPTKRNDQAFSPKIGLIYQPNKEMSIFASYADSFIPNSGTDIYGATIEPSIINQYEVGVKKDFWKGLLTTNVTLYHIVNSNLAQTAPFKLDGTDNADTTVKVLGGETTSKGIEIDITARPLEGFSIMAGYSYNDMRYTDTSGTNGSYVEGDRVVRTPANTANLSFFYTLPSGVLKGLSFGAIGNYIGDRLGGWNDDYLWTEIKPETTPKTYVVTIRDRDIPLEAYTTIDVSAGYTWKQFSILCKLSNITNELNYTVHENYSVNPIAPRQIMTSLKYQF